MAQPSVRRSLWIVLAILAVCVVLRRPVQRAYRDYERERLARESNALAPGEKQSNLQMPAEKEVPAASPVIRYGGDESQF